MKKFKKVSSLLFLPLVALVFTFASCGDDDDNVSSVLKFNPNKVEVEVAKTAIVKVSGGTAPYTVASSDEKTATVKVDEGTITITGVKVGTVNIVVKDKANNSGTISVTVKATGTILNFDKNDVNVAIGKEDVVTVTGGVAPYAATSNNAAIASATVKENKIRLKGLKAGTTTITVTDKDKKSSGTISVTVK